MKNIFKTKQKKQNKRMPTIYEIFKSKTTGKLHSVTFIAMYVNGIVWTFYGIVKIDPTIIISNACSVLFGIFYTFVFIYYVTYRTKTIILIFASFIMIAVIASIFSS